MRHIILFLIFFSAIVSSCVTQKKCNSKFPPSTETVTIVKERDSIVYKDTTIFIKLPQEYMTDSVIIPCPPPATGFIPDTAYAETSLAFARAWFNWPNIKLQLTQKDTTIEKRLADAQKESYYWRSEYNKVKIIPPPVKYIPGIYRIAFWLWIFVILSIAGFLILKFRTKLFNTK
jgi:hypothetical protein